MRTLGGEGPLSHGLRRASSPIGRAKGRRAASRFVPGAVVIVTAALAHAVSAATGRKKPSPCGEGFCVVWGQSAGRMVGVRPTEAIQSMRWVLSVP